MGKNIFNKKIPFCKKLILIHIEKEVVGEQGGKILKWKEIVTPESRVV